MHAEPIELLQRQLDEIPSETLRTIDYVLSDPRGILYVDGRSIVLTPREAREVRERH